MSFPQRTLPPEREADFRLSGPPPIGAALEEGRLSVNVRLFSDERDRDLVTGLVHEVLLALVGIAIG